ncbi:unnamed protein product [Pipistrellus nathusii]|uniref:Lipocalin/cytosolic fatty-acid binding domain-containing protein n=1 Tax=Pipistrellus nathusii TaxID=59473 RepID=A0ABN9Z4Y7_PIPNA
MGPPWALWVLLGQLDALAGVIPPSNGPTTVQTKQAFEVDKFQGEWFVLGLAGSTHSKADQRLLSPFTATFTQNNKQQLEVTYAMVRGQRCVTWSYVLIPTARPGAFSVQNREELGTDTEDVWVRDTDYSTFALMSSRRQSARRAIVRVHLLCEPPRAPPAGEAPPPAGVAPPPAGVAPPPAGEAPPPRERPRPS